MPTKIATAARNLAKEILRSQMAVRIQERISAAEADLIKAVRAFAVTKRDWAKEDADAAEKQAKAKENRKSFDEALASLESLTEAERKAAAEAVHADRKESDTKDAEEAEQRAKNRAEMEASMQKRVAAAREDVAHHKGNLAKLEKGELKVDADELKTLSQKLIEEGRVTEVSEVSAEE